ncbi:type IV pilin-like G/H family protein, partial [Planktothrix sp.]|uniref:type IV pilin-like G/H family protein n=1 Tax=Planktothrix sp. TaxID=3088171 RepID=UPI0038D3A6FE
LPSFLHQANTAKQSDGKQYLSSSNQGQQTYYAENTAFGATISELGIGLKTQTSNFVYANGVASGGTGATSSASPASSAMKAYAAGVGLSGTGEAKTTSTVLCEQVVAANWDAPNSAGFSATGPICGGSQSAVTK